MKQATSIVTVDTKQKTTMPTNANIVRPLSFVDFCAGIGGGRCGLETNHLQCVGFCEIDASAETTYRMLYDCPKEKNFGDLTKISPQDLPNFDMLIAGFPCQAFSIMGDRNGFDDQRGQIIYYLANILQTKNTPYFILENVKGILNHNDGKTMQKILAILDNAGYKVFYKLLNSLQFGVPQMRERVYFVGIQKQIAQLIDNNQVSIQNTPLKQNDLATTEHYSPTYSDIFPWHSSTKTTNIADFLVSQNNEISSATTQWLQKYNHNRYNKGRYNFEQIVQKDYTIIDTRQSDLRLYIDKVPTLRAARKGILYTRDNKIRYLTAYEGLLLQGFSPTQAQKIIGKIPESKLLFQIGNAMTIPVIDHICQSLFDYLGIQNQLNTGQ